MYYRNILNDSYLHEQEYRFLRGPVRQAAGSNFLNSIVHLAKRTMVIKVGDSLPSIDLYENNPTNKVNIQKLCEGKKVIIFAVPGAFTPGCSKTHLPGFVQRADDLKKGGVEELVCISVNDPFVMGAWGNEHNTAGKVRMLADPEAHFTKAIEMQMDLPPLGGIRSKRYSMVVENGLVRELNIEPDGTGLSCSLADRIKM